MIYLFDRCYRYICQWIQIRDQLEYISILSMHLLINCCCMAQLKISHNEVDQEQAEEISRIFVVFTNFSRQSLHGPFFFYLSHERQLCHSHALPFYFFLSISININPHINFIFIISPIQKLDFSSLYTIEEFPWET